MSYATILIPGSGIIKAYGTDMQEFSDAIGIYLTTWSIVTFLFAYGSTFVVISSAYD
jgi:uncharacterized protein